MRSLFKTIKIILTLVLVIAIFVAGYFIADGYNLYKSVLEEVSLEEKVEEIRSDENYVSLEDVSQDYINAVISIEDKRFYEHFGIDLYSTGRAVLSNFQNKDIVSGGSTITQQLAKNLYFEQEQKITRKIAEAFMVLDIEENYEKDEILELYINIIYFGDGYYGIKEASNGYFEKEPNELDLNEATLLAGLPNAPSIYQLSNDSNYTYQRQITVINSMVENGYIDQATAEVLIQKVREERGM